MNNIGIYNKHSEHSINQAMNLLWFYSEGIYENSKKLLDSGAVS